MSTWCCNVLSDKSQIVHQTHHMSCMIWMRCCGLLNQTSLSQNGALNHPTRRYVGNVREDDSELGGMSTGTILSNDNGVLANTAAITSHLLRETSSAASTNTAPISPRSRYSYGTPTGPPSISNTSPSTGSQTTGLMIASSTRTSAMTSPNGFNSCLGTAEQRSTVQIA
ncbi:hypothetical protein C8Q76DRAFT_744759 [Earliella scabrosa]|nr:hypothetical protein C8Q76DRAFT_744759 [Earliella scabrosa]